MYCGANVIEHTPIPNKVIRVTEEAEAASIARHTNANPDVNCVKYRVQRILILEAFTHFQR